MTSKQYRSIYDTSYTICDDGKVYSLTKNGNLRLINGFLVENKNIDGYIAVRIKVNGSSRTFSVKKIIADHFPIRHQETAKGV